jgi:hypothetical protein
MRVYGRHLLTWCETPEGWALHCMGRRTALLHVIPDAVHPMWRVRLPDGRLTDMANLSWARDGAVAIALGALNRGALKEAA